MKLAPHGFRSTHQGFTLLEVILAMVLIALFMGSLFAIVKGSITASVEIQKVQQEDEEWSRFVALCRQTFESLPSTAILTLTSQSQGLGAYQELTISGMPECLAFGVSPFSYQDTILALKPEPIQQEQTPKYFLGLYREDLVPKESSRARGTINETTTLFAPADEQGRLWLPLLRDIQQLQWRFYHESSKEWKDSWEESTLPPLVELNLYKADAVIPYRMVFAIPTTKLTQGNGSGSNSSGSGNSTQGGNSQQGSGPQTNNPSGPQNQNNQGQNGGRGLRGDRGSRGGRGGNGSPNPNNGNQDSGNNGGRSQPMPPQGG